ncbi:MAG: hypothetical protein J4428_00825 [Candidatus Aenigmarchaeota archaeon]|nr:hypothetical protein [Candidatus Aenigmarchaeota archaeon]
MDIKGSFRRFTNYVNDTVENLMRRYGLYDIGPDAIGIDPSLSGTGIGGYNGLSRDGRQVIGVSPETLYGGEPLYREVAQHEAAHELLPIRLISGLVAFTKKGIVNISTLLAEADVMRTMVNDLGHRLDDIQGYQKIREGLYQLGTKIASVVGGAENLYKLARERGSEGLANLINGNKSLKSSIADFLSKYDPHTLQNYGMLYGNNFGLTRLTLCPAYAPRGR